jgi:hypothetical protein
MLHVAMRAPALIVALATTWMALAMPAMAQDAQTSPGQQLADRYVPVAYLREQERACAVPPQGGEPYLPLPVEMVLGNDRVLIRDGANGDEVVATGPYASELATYGPDTYMDFPGDPRRPGCTYETDERLRIEELGLVPTTYVHIVLDEQEQRLALQYWFYWYFNDWNNTHESDWEMIQLFWDDVGSVEDALQRPPARVGYSQHGNGELADWDDPKLELEDDTHPRVYPAAGSHATFYSNETFLAWGERNSGFGCDVSSAPSVRTPLKAVVVPDEIDPNGEFAWLLYEGRWGERQPGPFNGPVGASLNGRWIDPWGAADNWRPVSIVVPGSKALGPTMTDAFCSLTEAGSRALIYSMIYPWVGLPLFAAVAVALVLLYRRSRHLFHRAISMYRQNWRLFAGIGLLAIPIGIVFNIVELYLINRAPLETMVEWFDNTAGARLSAVAMIGGIQQLAMLLIIAPAVIQAVADIHRDRQASIVRSYALAAQRALPIAGAFLILLVLAGIPLLLVIGLPIAVWLVVRWQFFAQALVFDPHQTSVGSLRESATLVSGRWWRTLGLVFIFDLIATVPGILVGFGLLTLGRTAVTFANGVSSLLYSLTIPVAVIAVTLMYLDRREAADDGANESHDQNF